jgi:hypothetical protein
MLDPLYHCLEGSMVLIAYQSQILGPYTDQGATADKLLGRSVVGRNAAPADDVVAKGPVAFNSDVEQVHWRFSEEPCDHGIHRLAVEVHRRSHLLEVAGIQYCDAIGEDHRILLISGDEQRRDPVLILEPDEIVTKLQTKRCVDTGHWFVEKQHPWSSHERPCHLNRLGLSSREFPATTIEQVTDSQLVGFGGHALGDDIVSNPSSFEWQRDIALRGSALHQCVPLCDHPETSISRQYVGDDSPVGQDVPVVEALQTRCDSHCGALAAPRRTNQREELTTPYFDIEPDESVYLAERPRNMFERETGHGAATDVALRSRC